MEVKSNSDNPVTMTDIPGEAALPFKTQQQNVLQNTKGISSTCSQEYGNGLLDQQWVEAEEKLLASKWGCTCLKVVYNEEQARIAYYCEACESELNTKKIVEVHCAGAKHRRKLAECEANLAKGLPMPKRKIWGFGIDNPPPVSKKKKVVGRILMRTDKPNEITSLEGQVLHDGLESEYNRSNVPRAHQAVERHQSDMMERSGSVNTKGFGPAPMIDAADNSVSGPIDEAKSCSVDGADVSRIDGVGPGLTAETVTGPMNGRAPGSMDEPDSGNMDVPGTCNTDEAGFDPIDGSSIGPIVGPGVGSMNGPCPAGPMNGPGPGPINGFGPRMGQMNGPRPRMSQMNINRLRFGPMNGPRPRFSPRIGPMNGPCSRIGPMNGPGPRMGPMHGPGPRMGPMNGPGPRMGPMNGPGPRMGPMNGPHPFHDFGPCAGPRPFHGPHPGDGSGPMFDGPGPRFDGPGSMFDGPGPMFDGSSPMFNGPNGPPQSFGGPGPFNGPNQGNFSAPPDNFSFNGPIPFNGDSSISGPNQNFGPSGPGLQAPSFAYPGSDSNLQNVSAGHDFTGGPHSTPGFQGAQFPGPPGPYPPPGYGGSINVSSQASFETTVVSAAGSSVHSTSAANSASSGAYDPSELERRLQVGAALASTQKTAGPEAASHKDKKDATVPIVFDEECLASGGSTGILLKKLAGCVIKSEKDADLAVTVSNSLVTSLREHYIKKGELKVAELLMTAELKLNTLRAMKVGLRLLDSELKSAAAASPALTEPSPQKDGVLSYSVAFSSPSTATTTTTTSVTPAFHEPPPPGSAPVMKMTSNNESFLGTTKPIPSDSINKSDAAAPGVMTSKDAGQVVTSKSSAEYCSTSASTAASNSTADPSSFLGPVQPPQVLTDTSKPPPGAATATTLAGYTPPSSQLMPPFASQTDSAATSSAMTATAYTAAPPSYAAGAMGNTFPYAAVPPAPMGNNYYSQQPPMTGYSMPPHPAASQNALYNHNFPPPVGFPPTSTHYGGYSMPPPQGGPLY